MTKKFILVVLSSFFICTILSGCGVFESEESYKKNAVFIEDLKEFSRQPDKYKDKQFLITRRIKNISQDGKKVALISTPSSSDPLVIHYEMKDSERQIQQDDVVRIWGTFKQISNKKLVDFMPASKVIEIDAKYISIPAWNFIDNSVGRIFLKTTTEKKQPLMLSLSPQQITQDTLNLDGYIFFENKYFNIKGNINDLGTGTFEYVDSQKKATGAKGTLKVIDQKTIEIQTDQSEVQVPGFPLFGKPAEITTIILPAGTYVFKD